MSDKRIVGKLLASFMTINGRWLVAVTDYGTRQSLNGLVWQIPMHIGHDRPLYTWELVFRDGKIYVEPMYALNEHHQRTPLPKYVPQTIGEYVFFNYNDLLKKMMRKV